MPRCRGTSRGNTRVLMERGMQGPAKKFAALVHVHSLAQGAEEEKVFLTQKGNAHLKQENGTFF